MRITLLLQCIAAAPGSVVAKTVISDYFTEHVLHKAATCMVLVWTLNPIISPVLGSYLEPWIN